MTSQVAYGGRPTRILDYSVIFTDCFTCGVPIAMTPSQMRQFDEHGMTIYCVLGHKTVRRESDNQRLQRELREAQGLVARLETRVVNTEGLLTAETTRRRALEKRVNNGVCPHCRRTFRQLARHMKSKHLGSIVRE